MRFGLLYGTATVAATSTTVEHCGPTDQEVGQAILLVLPVVLLVSLGLQWLVLRLWRRRTEGIALGWRPALILVGVLVGPALAVLVRRPERLDLAWPALCLFGTAYLALLVVAARLWLALDPRRAFVVPHLVPLVPTLGAAVPLALGLIEHLPFGITAEAFFTFGGLGMWAAGPLWAASLVEAWLRTRRKAQVS